MEFGVLSLKASLFRCNLYEVSFNALNRSVMTLFCCAMVSFRFAISLATSFRLVFLLLRSGETETLAVGNGGSSFRVGRGAVVVVCVLSDCWVSITFALDFLRRPFDGAVG